MIKPKRYLCGGYVGLMHEFAKGDWVNWSDYAILQAEVERLQNNCDYLDRELDREIEKSAMLCGQVERLTEQNRSQTAAHRIFTSMWKDENDRLRSEVERLTDAITRGTAITPDAHPHP